MFLQLDVESCVHDPWTGDGIQLSVTIRSAAQQLQEVARFIRVQEQATDSQTVWFSPNIRQCAYCIHFSVHDQVSATTLLLPSLHTTRSSVVHSQTHLIIAGHYIQLATVAVQTYVTTRLMF